MEKIKERLELKAHDFAVNTLIIRHFPEYESIRKNRLKILIKLNNGSENKPNKNNG